MINILLGLVLLFVFYLAMRLIRHPGIALGLIWSTFALEQFLQYSSGFFASQGKLVNIGTILIAIMAIAFSISSRRWKQPSLTRSHLWWGALMLLTVISTRWSIYSGSQDILVSALPYIVGFVVIGPFCAQDDEQIDRAIQVSVFFGGFVLLGLLFCTFGQRAIVVDSLGGRDVEGNPLAVASYGGYVTICAIFSLYKKRSNLITTVLKSAIAMLGLYMIVRSGSRGQLIGVVVSCAIWLPIVAGMTFKKSNVILLVIAIVIFVIGVSWTENVGMTKRWEIDSIVRDRDGRLYAAETVMRSNLAAGPTAWLFGLGSSASFKILGIYPHFVPAEVFAEEGLVGFTLFFGFLIVSTLEGWKVLRSKNISMETRVNTGALLTLVTFQFGLCLKQGSLLGSPLLFCVGLCIAVSARRILKVSEKSIRSRNRLMVARAENL